ncbi:carbon-monoxide dehydrogenase medium subunit [Microtetraspora sp. NBRC 13810]|uniref:FAD binding domain-containing protein n=1 Tax=Microtetraspora sp. NBRC 13810 TaxID=3030990 RepID=UPI0024A3AA71|nr:xanthine dehydrogenase family protein subunit M [Microtetraspora sp. NBRC 13810]GLW05524.1 carbon-monoxide dehydrogenase medium subunit [Microtetraspora sp. NBRC 13810]
MIPAAFDYVRPESLAEACEALADAGEDAKVLAGGQSLLPLLRLRLSFPSTLVDVGRLTELHDIRDGGDHVFIGAGATHYDVVRSPLVNAACPLVALAAATVADPAVRHRGTFGGALAHADPAGDLPAVAVALDCVFTARSANGEREIPAAEFFVDYLEPALAPDEILTGIRVPKLGPGWGYHYEKFHRTAQSWAIVGVAAAVRRSNGVVEEARIGLTNMGPTPLRARGVEDALRGAGIHPAAPDDGGADPIRDACGEAAAGSSPPSDLHAQPDYRRHLARALTHRAVRAAARA